METDKTLLLEIASYIVGLETGGASYIGTPSAQAHKDNIINAVRTMINEDRNSPCPSFNMVDFTNNLLGGGQKQ